MSLGMSVGAFVAGLGGLAAVLYLLQRLRVRHRQKKVVTTLFWKEALEETRARVFRLRFRHLLAYLLVLLISSLLWLALAEPRAENQEGREVVVLIDGSAGMAWGDRFDRTLELVRDQLDVLSTEKRRVIFCGSHPRTLLAPGEANLLLDARGQDSRPEACPATVERTIRELERQARSNPVTYLIAGDAPLGDGLIDLLGDDVRVRRLAPPPREGAGNRGITAIGVTAAASGAWDLVDVLVEVRGEIAESGGLFSSSLGGRALQTEFEARVEEDRGRFVLRDLPARGEILSVHFTRPDRFSFDDGAQIVLPDRPRIRVALSPALRDLLGPVLGADPAIVVTDENPHVAVRRAGEPTGGRTPAIEFVSASTQDDAFLLHHDAPIASETILLESLERLGLDEIDAMDVAAASGRVISIGAVPGEQKMITVWDILLSEQYDFVHSRSFPLFVALGVRWLVGDREFPSFAAVGEPVRGASGPFVDGAGQTLDAVGTELRPPRPGVYRGAGGLIAASFLDAPTTTGAPDAVVERSVDPVAGAGASDLVTWIMLGALLLLFCEWLLFRTGRIP